MGTLSIDIVLDKAGYYSGEELSGKLVLANQPDKPEVPVNNVIVKLNGVIGIGQMNKSSNSKQESHRQTQQIVLLKLDLPVPEGKVESGQKVIIPFEFMLPEQGKLASSLEASYGYVRYWIDAILPDLWASSETPFGYRNVLIYDVVDTNSPQSFSVIPRGQLSFQNGCCGGRDADIKVRLNRCIFMPGEVIVASCKGYNFSGHVLRPYLQLLYNFRTGSRQIPSWSSSVDLKPPSDVPPTVVSERFDGRFKVYGVIPTSPPLTPDVRHCLLEVEYSVKLEIDIPGIDTNSEEMPIIFGTVPYLNEDSFEISQQPMSKPLYHLDANTLKLLTTVYNRKRTLPKLSHLPIEFKTRFQAQLPKSAWL